MGRPSLEDNAVYRKCRDKIAPLDGVVAEAERKAKLLVEAAKMQVENDLLQILREGLEGGLSQYAVGKLTGKTRAEDQRRMVALAMGADWVRSNPTGLPHVVIEQDGWIALLVRMWRTNHDRFATDWQVTWPDGELLFTHEEDQWYLVPENFWHVVPDNLMPDELFFGMRAWKPEN